MASCIRILSFSLCFLFLMTPSPALAAQLKEPLSLTLIAQEPGTSFYTHATTLARFMLDVLPKGSEFNVIPRGGSMSNPTALDQGKGDFTLTQSSATAWAWEGLEGQDYVSKVTCNQAYDWDGDKPTHVLSCEGVQDGAITMQKEADYA